MCVLVSPLMHASCHADAPTYATAATLQGADSAGSALPGGPPKADAEADVPAPSSSWHDAEASILSALDSVLDEPMLLVAADSPQDTLQPAASQFSLPWTLAAPSSSVLGSPSAQESSAHGAQHGDMASMAAARSSQAAEDTSHAIVHTLSLTESPRLLSPQPASSQPADSLPNASATALLAADATGCGMAHSISQPAASADALEPAAGALSSPPEQEPAQAGTGTDAAALSPSSDVAGEQALGSGPAWIADAYQAARPVSIGASPAISSSLSAK